MRKIGILFAVTILILGFTPTITRAQNAPEESKSKVEQSEKGGAADQARAVQAFRLDFSFNELVDGKKANTRHYSLDLTSGSKNQLKIGTRVPVATGVVGTNPLVSSTQWQYMDVGTKIWASLFPRPGGDLELQVDSEISNLDIPQSHNQNPAGFADAHPVMRQLQIGGTTLLETGKPILIGTMDDPNSSRQFQLEVTVTKLK